MNALWSRRFFVRSVLRGVVPLGAVWSAPAARAATTIRAPVGSADPPPANQGALLRAAMDRIIPAGQGMPSAGEAGCLDYLVSTSQADDGLRTELTKALDAVQGSARAAFGRAFDALDVEEQIATLRRLEGADPLVFRGLRDAVYEAYYTRPDIRRRLGHEFYPPERPGPLPPPFEESILTRVRRMPILYRTPRRMSARDPADVVVVGAGAAGAAVSWRLATKGVRVVCLEQGDWVKPEEFPSTRPEVEVQFRRGRFHLSPNV